MISNLFDEKPWHIMVSKHIIHWTQKCRLTLSHPHQYDAPTKLDVLNRKTTKLQTSTCDALTSEHQSKSCIELWFEVFSHHVPVSLVIETCTSVLRCFICWLLYWWRCTDCGLGFSESQIVPCGKQTWNVSVKFYDCSTRSHEIIDITSPTIFINQNVSSTDIF